MLGGRTTQVYDLAGRVVVRRDALGGRSTTVYDATGATLATINPLGQRTSNGYDGAGRQVFTRDVLGNRTSTVYDATGTTIAQVNPLGQRSTSLYDPAGASSPPLIPWAAAPRRSLTAPGSAGHHQRAGQPQQPELRQRRPARAL